MRNINIRRNYKLFIYHDIETVCIGTIIHKFSPCSIVDNTNFICFLVG